MKYTTDDYKAALCNVCQDIQALNEKHDKHFPLCEDCETTIAEMVAEDRRLEVMERIGTPLGEVNYQLFV